MMKGLTFLPPDVHNVVVRVDYNLPFVKGDVGSLERIRASKENDSIFAGKRPQCPNFNALG